VLAVLLGAAAAAQGHAPGALVCAFLARSDLDLLPGFRVELSGLHGYTVTSCWSFKFCIKGDESCDCTHDTR
jgi:hypothetical protein